MTLIGRVHNGVIDFEQPVLAAEGTLARVELLEVNPNSATPPVRQGGQWKGQVEIAPDFDHLPSDLQEAFGMQES